LKWQKRGNLKSEADSRALHIPQMEQLIQTHELGKLQPINWVGLVFFTGCALFAWRADETGAAVALIPFVVLSGLLLSFKVSIGLDSRGITRRSKFGTHRMAWDEILRVETDGVTWVLAGENKRLPIAPRFWARDSRDAAVTLLEQQLAARGIPRVSNPRASYATAGNTRV
jgi:hypothetical protein